MWSILIQSFLLGCNSQEPATNTPEKKEDAFQEVNLDDLEKAAEKATVNLVPPPLELQNELKKRGLTSDLSTFVGQKDLSMNIDNTDQIALRAGVLISDLVFTIKTGSYQLPTPFNWFISWGQVGHLKFWELFPRVILVRDCSFW